MMIGCLDGGQDEGCVHELQSPCTRMSLVIAARFHRLSALQLAGAVVTPRK